MVTSTLRNWKKIGSAPSVWIGFRQWRALHPASCFDSNPADGKWKDVNEENMKVNAVNVAHREMRTTWCRLQSFTHQLATSSATKKIVKRFPMRRLFRAETKASDGKHDWFG